jgi:multifunctional beta-oxidation protein
VGFSKALAIEGRKSNIIVNCISPSAGTNLTRGVLPEVVVQSRKPDYVAPIVLLLSSDKIPVDASGQIFEAGCGWQARTRLQRSDGYDFPHNTPLTPEMVLDKWSEIVSFTPGKTSSPEVIADSRARILANIKTSGDIPPSGRQWLDAIAKARNAPAQRSSMTFTDKEVLLYNLSLGSTPSQLPLVFEKHPNFHVLPSFGVIPGTTASRPFKLEDLVPNFDYKNMLHGEHLLEIRKYPIPTSGTFVSECRLIDILDKGKASIAIIGTLTKDAATGDEVFYNELTLFLRGTGGFGRKTARSEHSSTKSSSTSPSRKPDMIIEEKTSTGQAVLYRLNGDRNPLHIDPAVSSAGGFNNPILHGLCTFGIATKQIILNYGPIKSIRARFVGVVTPGETLQIESWKDGNDITFQVRIAESGKFCIAGGCATLEQSLKTRL